MKSLIFATMAVLAKAGHTAPPPEEEEAPVVEEPETPEKEYNVWFLQAN